MASDQFTIGKTYYLSDGQEVELVALTSDGRFIVVENLEVETYDGTDLAQGRQLFADEIYATPPRARIEESVAALKAEEADLRKRVDVARSELLDAKRDNVALLERLKSHDALRYIDDFIEGKITHYVAVDGGRVRVFTVNDRCAMSGEEKHERDRKLLSLYGRSGGNFYWRLNWYSDGSGSRSEDCYPCRSEDEASQKAREIVAAGLTERHSNWHFRTDAWIESAERFEVPVPPKMLEERQAKKLKDARDRLVRAEQSAARDKERLAELRAEVAKWSEPALAES